MIDFSLYTTEEPDKIGEAVAAFRYKDFTDERLFKMVMPHFEKSGYELLSVRKAKKAKKVGGVSQFDTKLIFSNGVILILGITFEGHGKAIKPDDTGVIINAKLGSTEIPLAMRKGESMSFKQMLKFIIGKMNSLMTKEQEKVRKKQERMAQKAEGAIPAPKGGVKTLSVQKTELMAQLESIMNTQQDLELQVSTYQTDLSVLQARVDMLRSEDQSLTTQIEAKQKELADLKAA